MDSYVMLVCRTAISKNVYIFPYAAAAIAIIGRKAFCIDKSADYISTAFTGRYKLVKEVSDVN